MKDGDYGYKGLIFSIRMLASEFEHQRKIYPKGSDFGVEMYWDFINFYEMFNPKTLSIYFDNITVISIQSFYLYLKNMVETSEDNFFDFDVIENDPRWKAIRTAAKTVLPYFNDSVSRLDDENVIHCYIGSFNN